MPENLPWSSDKTLQRIIQLWMFTTFKNIWFIDFVSIMFTDWSCSALLWCEFFFCLPPCLLPPLPRLAHFFEGDHNACMSTGIFISAVANIYWWLRGVHFQAWVQIFWRKSEMPTLANCGKTPKWCNSSPHGESDRVYGKKHSHTWPLLHHTTKATNPKAAGVFKQCQKWACAEHSKVDDRWWKNLYPGVHYGILLLLVGLFVVTLY